MVEGCSAPAAWDVHRPRRFVDDDRIEQIGRVPREVVLGPRDLRQAATRRDWQPGSRWMSMADTSRVTGSEGSRRSDPGPPAFATSRAVSTRAGSARSTCGCTDRQVISWVVWRIALQGWKWG